MSAIVELANHHPLPEMAGGFIAYFAHAAYHKGFETIHKHLLRLPRRKPQA